jgi:hypothetical protein
MAVVVTAAYAGSYIRTFTVAALLADAAADSAATNHGLTGTPIDYTVVDTSPLATLSACPWAVHTVGATQFVVRKLIATNEDRTALVVLRQPQSIGR